MNPRLNVVAIHHRCTGEVYVVAWDEVSRPLLSDALREWVCSGLDFRLVDARIVMERAAGMGAD